MLAPELKPPNEHVLGVDFHALVDEVLGDERQGRGALRRSIGGANGAPAVGVARVQLDPVHPDNEETLAPVICGMGIVCGCPLLPWMKKTTGHVWSAV